MFLIVCSLIMSVFLSLVSTNSCSAETIWEKARPDYAKIQYAGNIGFISVGTGKYFFSNKVTADFFYGFLPAYINNVSVHTIAFKPAFHFKPFTILNTQVECYTGTSFNYSIASNTYLVYPDYFPEGYYEPKAIHFDPFLGISAVVPKKINKKGKLFVYAELGSVDYKIIYAVRNKRISFDDICNLCCGIIYKFF